MRKFYRFIIFLFITFILFDFKIVMAADITIDDVVNYMNANSIFDDSEYYDLFGDMFDREENDISKITYEVTKEAISAEAKEPTSSSLKIKVSLEDALKEESIEKEYVLNITDNNKISYTSNYDKNSLDARVITFLFDEIIYSVGGARGYNKDYLVEWMNQIDLNKVTLEEGIKCDFESVFYTVNKDGTDYEYELNIFKNFTIDINAITKEIPEIIATEIHDVKPSYTDISLKFYVKNHTDDLCIVYRREESETEYRKIGQVKCNDEEFVDSNVESGKTYYYQATVEGVIMCSEEVKASLEELPLTGAFLSIGSIVALIILEVVIFKFYKKYKKVQKI